MDLKTLLEKLEKEFFRSLDKKTGWGKEEIKKEFNKAVTNVLILTYSKIKKDVGEGEREQ